MGMADKKAPQAAPQAAPQEPEEEPTTPAPEDADNPQEDAPDAAQEDEEAVVWSSMGWSFWRPPGNHTWTPATTWRRSCGRTPTSSGDAGLSNNPTKRTLSLEE